MLETSPTQRPFGCVLQWPGIEVSEVPRVVVPEDLGLIPAVLGLAEGPELGEPDPMAPAPAVEFPLVFSG